MASGAATVPGPSLDVGDAGGEASAGRVTNGETGPRSRLAGGSLQALAWTFAAAGTLVALGPLLLLFGLRLWSKDYYQFFPLLLLAASWIGYRRYRAAAADGFVPGRPWVRGVAWGAGVLAVVAALGSGSPFVAVVGLLILLLAAFYERGGWTLVRLLLPVWALLLIIVPPPFGLDAEVVARLQGVATSFASGLLDLVGMRHLADGVKIRLPGADFFVDAGCSGIHSLFASLTFAAVVAITFGYGPVRAFALMGAAVAWVILANAARVFAVVVLSTRFGLPVKGGLGHEAIGVVAFAVIVGLILSTDRLLLFLFPGGGNWWRAAFAALRGRPVDEGEREAVSLRSPPRPRLGGLVAVGIVLLGLGGADLALGHSGATIAAVRGQAAPKGVPAETLPDEWDGWRRQGFDVQRRSPLDPAGEWSRIWTYRKGGLTAAVSVDGPYAEWHDLSTCYIAAGHEIAGFGPVMPDAADREAAHTRIALSRSGRHGRVLFSAYTYSDQPVAPPGSFSRRLGGMLNGRYRWLVGRDAKHEPVYQVQLFSEGWLPYTPADEQELTALFREMRARIVAAEAGVAGPADESGGGRRGDET